MTVDQRAYWVWLQSGVGAGAAVDGLLSVFPSPEAFYALDPDEWRISGALTYAQIGRLKNADLDRAAAVVKRCDANGWRIVTPDRPDYPKLLLRTRDFPLVLFARGELSCVNAGLPVAVVGSRTASPHSVSVAVQLCESLARAGATVVSGCALGVDSAAHTGALRGGGKTVAVLGCGINFPYLMQNEALRNEIARNGAVVSEYPPDTPVARSSFPMRNRIISGMCRGTVIIQAGDKSGSLITANRAAEQGRDLFAVPGDVTSPDYIGVNKLIRDGAKPVFSAYDVLCEYAALYPGIDLSKAGSGFVPAGQAAAPAPFAASAPATFDAPAPTPFAASAPTAAAKSADTTRRAERADGTRQAAVKAAAARPLPGDAGDDAVRVYAALSEGPLHIDELVVKTGIGTTKIFTALTELEIYGFIKLLEGKRYERI